MRRVRLVSAVLVSVAFLAMLSCIGDNNPSGNSNIDPLTRHSQYYYVTNPYDGQAVQMGALDTITWVTTQSSATTLSIYLCEDTVVVSTVATYVTNDGFQTWTVPNSGSGDNYRLKLVSTTDPTKYDYSYPFTITSLYSGTVAVRAPSADTVWTRGSSYNVTWTSTGDIGAYVIIELYNDTTLYSTISSYTANDGSQSWSISSSTPTDSQYRIKVSSYYDTSINTYSDYFTISSGYTGSISVTSPSADTAWTRGTTDTIKWTTTGNIGSYVRIDLCTDSTPYSTLSSMTTDDGVHPWAISSSMIAGNRYRIKVSSYYDTSIHAYSDFFTVLSGYTGTLQVTSPDSTTTWAAGSAYDIEWISTGNIGGYANVLLCRDTIVVATVTTSNSTSAGVDIYSWSVPQGIASGTNYRIRVEAYYDPMIYDYSDYFDIAGTAQDDAFEYDGRRDSANAIGAFGVAQAHSLTYNDSDWVTFQADSGNLYAIRTVGGAVTTMYVFRGTSTSYLDNASGSTSTRITEMVFQPTATGTYYLLIRPYSSSSYFGDYDLQINEYDSESGVTFISPTAGQEVTAGTYDTISWNPDSLLLGTYVTLQLYTDSTYLSSISTMASNSGRYVWDVPDYMESGGHYRIRLTGYYSSNVGGYSDTFTISGIDPDAYEVDNRRTIAKSISTDGVVQSRNLTLNDTDWVSFQADSGKMYAIGTTGDAAMYVYLYVGAQSNYTTSDYGTSSSTPTSIRYTATTTGTHYLRIQPYYSTSYLGEYTLQVAEYDPDSSVTVVSPNASNTWAVGSSYTIQWETDSIVVGNYVTISLYDDTTMVYAITSSYTSNSGQYSWSVPSAFASGTAYRIRVASYSYSGISGYSAPFSIAGIAPDAYEIDNRRTLAQPIPVTGAAQSRSLTYSDTDWVSFQADSGKMYAIGTTGQATMYVYLYVGAQSNYTDYDYNSSPSTANSLRYTATTNGTHYLMIRPYTSSSYYGTYSLQVAEFDPDSSLTVTAPSASNTWAVGSSYSIQWQPDSLVVGNYVTLSLYNDTSLVYSISTYASNSGQYSWTVPSAFASGSAYRIRVASYSYTGISGYSAPFSIAGIARDAYEIDNRRTQSQSIPVTGAAQNRSLTYNDTDWVKFTASPGRYYRVGTTSSVSHYVYVYMHDSTQYAYYDYGAGTAISFSRTDTATVYLRITQSSTSSGGAYTLTVKEYDPATAITFTNPTSGSTWASGSAYTIQWTPDSALFPTYVSLYLYRYNRQMVTISSLNTNTGTQSITLASALESGHIYRIKMVDYSDPTVYAFSDTFTISGTAGDAYEPDDSVAQAHTISANGTAEQHTAPYLDLDWYKFSATGGKLYTVGTRGTLRTSLYLYDTNRSSLLASANTSQTYDTARVVWVAPATGTYYFRISAGLTGSYEAVVTEWDSSSYGYTVTSPAQGSSYALGAVVTITWTNPVLSGGYVDLFLYPSSGAPSIIQASTLDDGTQSWTIPGTVTPGAGYSVKVSSTTLGGAIGNSGTFTITP